MHQTNYDALIARDMDVLQEIGNIGAGNAITSLSLLLEQTVNMKLPRVNLLNHNDVPAELGGAEALTYGVAVPLLGEVDGMILFLLDKQLVHVILNLLMNRQYGSFEELDPIALSAIKEVGNILTGAYVNSISEMTGLHIGVGMPSASVDMMGALLNLPMARFGDIGDKVLFIEEDFHGKQDTVMSHMILFAEADSLRRILGKLGISE